MAESEKQPETIEEAAHANPNADAPKKMLLQLNHLI